MNTLCLEDGANTTEPRLLAGDLRASFSISLLIERCGEFEVRVTGCRCTKAVLTDACKDVLTAQSAAELRGKIRPTLRRLSKVSGVEFWLLTPKSTTSSGLLGRGFHGAELLLTVSSELRLPRCRSGIDPLHRLGYLRPTPSAVHVEMPVGVVELLWRCGTAGADVADVARTLMERSARNFASTGRYASGTFVSLLCEGPKPLLGLKLRLPPIGLPLANMRLYEPGDFRGR